MPYYVYLLECADGTYYCGYTSGLEERVYEHNHTDQGARYTKYRRPVKLVYAEEFQTKSAAMSKEYEIKGYTRRQKESLAGFYAAQ